MRGRHEVASLGSLVKGPDRFKWDLVPCLVLPQTSNPVSSDSPAYLPSEVCNTAMEPYASRIKDVLERRAKAGRFAPGVAAYSDSDMFKKTPVCPATHVYYICGVRS